jgi:hypothetical protein
MTYLPEYADPAIALPTLREGMAQYQARYIMTALVRSKGNVCKAAAELGVHRNTLERMRVDLGIQKRYGRPGRPESRRKPFVWPPEQPQTLPAPGVPPRRHVTMHPEVSPRNFHAASFERDAPMSDAEQKKELAASPYFKTRKRG